MNLESQVSSLELSKRLKELGVEQESYFVYIQDTPKTAKELPNWKIKNADSWRLENMFDWVSAFTVAELGEILPMSENNFHVGRTLKGTYFIMYGVNCTDGSSLADAFAKMLIYLLENKLITL